MACEGRERILRLASHQGLEALLDQSLLLIRENIFEKARFVNPTRELQAHISKPLARTEIWTPSERIKELGIMDLVRLVPEVGPKASVMRGVYLPRHGRIYLKKDAWCIKTIIHETLHACSLMSLVKEDNERYLERYWYLYEGLTETITGYILYKALAGSYTSCWRITDGKHCQLTYEPYTKLWGTLFHFIPIKKANGIYFYQDSDDWKSLFSDFISDIKGRGTKTFENPLEKRGQMPISEILKSECRNFFGKESFDAIYYSRKRYTDFSSIVDETR